MNDKSSKEQLIARLSLFIAAGDTDEKASKFPITALLRDVRQYLQLPDETTTRQPVERFSMERSEDGSRHWMEPDPQGDWVRYVHASDCSTNNGPALPVGPCDCSSEEPSRCNECGAEPPEPHQPHCSRHPAWSQPRELAPSEAASFEKTLVRSPRRMEEPTGQFVMCPHGYNRLVMQADGTHCAECSPLKATETPEQRRAAIEAAALADAHRMYEATHGKPFAHTAHLATCQGGSGGRCCDPDCETCWPDPPEHGPGERT